MSMKIKDSNIGEALVQRVATQPKKNIGESILFVPEFTVSAKQVYARAQSAGQEYAGIAIDIPQVDAGAFQEHRVMIYADTVSYGAVPVIKVDDLANTVQSDYRTSKILEVPISENRRYCIVYAAVLDKDGNPVHLFDAVLFTNTETFRLERETFFFGLYGGHDLQCEAIDMEDIDGVGYPRVAKYEESEISLAWRDMLSIGRTEWEQSVASRFRNTMGEKRRIEFETMVHFQRYVVYSFRSSNGLPPPRLYPYGAGAALPPTIKDENGIWILEGTTTSSSITIPIAPGQTLGYWVGMLFGRASR